MRLARDCVRLVQIGGGDDRLLRRRVCEEAGRNDRASRQDERHDTRAQTLTRQMAHLSRLPVRIYLPSAPVSATVIRVRQ